jgi:hypothetical protein
MWIDLEDAIRIYSRMLRARLGPRRGAEAALEMADHLRAKGDRSGVEAWEAVAAELAPRDRETVDSMRLGGAKMSQP